MYCITFLARVSIMHKCDANQDYHTMCWTSVGVHRTVKLIDDLSDMCPVLYFRAY